MSISNDRPGLEVIEWANHVSTAGGGTRTTIKLNRPWESFLQVDPTHCPFCQNSLREPSLFPVDAGWKVIANAFTPFAYHRLILPATCWPLERMQTLGGVDQIQAALQIAAKAIAMERHRDIQLGTHIGPLAGQNISHLHYHLLEPIRSPSIKNVGAKLRKDSDPRLVVRKSDDFTIAVGGIRAGQMLILPNDSALPATEANLSGLAESIAWSIDLGARKFLSAQGNAPEFMVGLSFVEGKFDWGYYLPILNHMGFTEYFGIMEGTPMILPWPHEQTAAFLKDQ